MATSAARKTCRTLAAAMIGLASTATRAATPVYSQDFENPPGKEWSADKVEATPKDNRHFLGGFSTETVTLKLDKLPPHKYVRVALELFIMESWDGNATLDRRGDTIGPDCFRMSVEGGVTLVDATFSNHDFETDLVPKEARTQSYPSVLPGESYPAKTGAAENNALGFERTFRDRITRPMDSVYKLNFVIPHDAPTIQFNFRGAEGLKTGEDECWGLDNVKVEALTEADVKKLDATEMRKLWEAIGGHDPAAETDAFWRLVAGGDDVAQFLRGKVKPAGIDRKRFQQLVRQLDGDGFETRDKATTALREMGPAIESLLRDALENADSPEVKLRLAAAIRGLAKAPPADPELRRHTIAMKLLRVIGTPEAQKVAADLTEK